MEINSASQLCLDTSTDSPRAERPVATRCMVPYLCSLLFLVAWPLGSLSAELPPVRVAYFVPSDREPIREYGERLDRVMTEVQRFYRDGMNAAGFGPATFALERGGQDRLMIHVVPGIHPMSTYGRNASAAVRQEVKTALAKQGIDMDRNTWVIFQVLLRWDGNKATEIGPYVGGGSHLTGTAWVYDDERLDPTTPGQPSRGRILRSTLLNRRVQFALHRRSRPRTRPCLRAAARLPEGTGPRRGHSLMGGGNHTYGQELRGEGAGTFLSSASAMLLAFSRPFAGELAGATRNPDSRWNDFDAQFADGKIVLSGTVAANPPAFGLVAFNDWAKIADDYDAVSWTCRVAEDGRFRLEVGELRPGHSQLRLWVRHTNGATSRFAFDYQVDEAGKPNIDIFRYHLPLDEAVAAYRRRDRSRVESLAASLKQRFPEVAGDSEEGGSLAGPAQPWPATALVRHSGHRRLDRHLPRQVPHRHGGLGTPAARRSPERRSGRVLSASRRPVLRARAVRSCSGKTRVGVEGEGARFRTAYGLQDGHDGSVVFVVRGDGRELVRSPLVKDHQLRKADVDVTGIQVLELSVEDGGDGANSDWGIWISPQIKPNAEIRGSNSRMCHTRDVEERIARGREEEVGSQSGPGIVIVSAWYAPARPGGVPLRDDTVRSERVGVLDGNGRSLWELTGEHFGSIDVGCIDAGLAGVQLAVDIDHRPWGRVPVGDAAGHRDGCPF